MFFNSFQSRFSDNYVFIAKSKKENENSACRSSLLLPDLLSAKPPSFFFRIWSSSRCQ